jgi:hypothetical protein
LHSLLRGIEETEPPVVGDATDNGRFGEEAYRLPLALASELGERSGRTYVFWKELVPEESRSSDLDSARGRAGPIAIARAVGVVENVYSFLRLALGGLPGIVYPHGEVI